MNRTVWAFLMSFIGVVILAGNAMAAGGEGSAEGGSSILFFTVVAASCAFAMSIASAGCGLAQGRAIANAMDSIARQPTSFKDIQMLLIIGLALIESLALYTMVIALILIYASPFTALVTGS